MPKNINEQASKGQPGMSGKDGNKSWANLKELNEQEDFIDQSNIASGDSDNLHGRRGLDDQVEATPSENDTCVDQKLHDAIAVALERNPETDLSKVSIQVSNRNIILKGPVTEAKAKRAIEAIVRNVPGVKEVLNFLEVTS
jgi:osmotically-inducible protein OsmY